jgi:hypothetical protein
MRLASENDSKPMTPRKDGDSHIIGAVLTQTAQGPWSVQFSEVALERFAAKVAAKAIEDYLLATPPGDA